MSRTDDFTADDRQAIAAALRHLKEEVLFAFGAEGDECIQRLVALEAALPGEQAAIFLAFSRGLAGHGPDAPHWSGPRALLPAYEIGRRATALNDRRRQESGLNIGPLDAPRTQMLMAAARAILDG